jgi:hypothetical protein
MIGVAAFWKVICQGDGCPSPASAGPQTASNAAELTQISSRLSIAIPSLPEPRPLYVRARRPVKAGRRYVNDVDGIGNPTPVGERQGGAQDVARNGVAPSFVVAPSGPRRMQTPKSIVAAFKS